METLVSRFSSASDEINETSMSINQIMAFIPQKLETKVRENLTPVLNR